VKIICRTLVFLKQYGYICNHIKDSLSLGKRVIEIKAKNGTIYLYEDESRLRKMVNQIDKKKRKHWSEQDMLRKVETYARVHFEGKYKDVYSTPTAAQRLVFDLLEIPYTFKGKGNTARRELLFWLQKNGIFGLIMFFFFRKSNTMST